MKILMITMHRVTNYGSVLQAWALKRKLEEMGFAVELLDYYPERQTVGGLMRRIGGKIDKPFPVVLLCQAAMLPSYLKRWVTFRRFRREHFAMTGRYGSLEELEAGTFNADLYCTGSDQVWNYVESEGVDGAYYWSFLPEGRTRFSYAASVGLTELGQEEGRVMRGYLERFAWISVREDSSARLLRELGLAGAAAVADPVFLLGADEWRRMAAAVRRKNDLLVYNIHRSGELDRFAAALARRLGLRLVYVGYAYHEKLKRGKYYCAPAVEKFLGLMREASFVVSDSFHATAFSLLFNKPFAVFSPPRYAVRITDLLERLGLKDRLVTAAAEAERISEAVDYGRVNRELDRMRMESAGLLERELRKMTDEKRG